MPEPNGYSSRPGRRGGARVLAPLALVLVGGAVAFIVIGTSASGGPGSGATSGPVGPGTASVAHRAPSAGAAHTVAPTATVAGSRSGGTVTGTTTAGTYTVAAGDTFAKISAATGVSIVSIESLNPHVSSNRLTIGQVLKLK